MVSQPDPQIDSAGSQRSAARQGITPELRRWIVEQTRAGHGAAAVLQSMRDADWHEEVAARALHGALPAPLEPAAAQAPLLARHVPGPCLGESPTRVDCGDRSANVLLAMERPRIVLLGEFLSPDECAALIADAAPRMTRSLTVTTETGDGLEVNAHRTSDGMFFQRGESPLLQRIEARMARLLNWPIVNGEGLQVLHYRPGAEYKPHYDYFDPAKPGTNNILARGGQRVATLVIYLNTPEKGGGTSFPDAQLVVAAQRGNAVFFGYDRPHPDTRSLHGGAPVIAGDKWIATKWLREREFT